MSYHIVHILTHASRLTVDRGCLVCVAPGLPEHRVPLQDTCAVIVAARGVSFSGDCLSSLLSSNAIVLHCDDNYRPIGKTVSLSRVVHSAIFERQINSSPSFNKGVWEVILDRKLANQSKTLELLGCRNPLRGESKIREDLGESNAARLYWPEFFSIFKDPPETREHRGASHPVNQMLNYGYAVMSALVHRSVLIHGLNPSLGIHHRFRFRSEPLVYDIMEPLRPIVDYMLARYHLNDRNRKIQGWVKEVAGALTGCAVEIKGKKIKLIYGIDTYVTSISEAFKTGMTNFISVPSLI